jgi:GntR family transcriptional regulator, colanic acid and biofilm gene transcriptional regulator
MARRFWVKTMNQASTVLSNHTAGTLGQQVYLRLRGRLLAGEWLPGTKLTLRGLAEELGTSVQPVREAVSRLSAERVLLVKPNSSLMLPPIDKEELDEIWALRLLLEREAARLCAVRLTEPQFAELDHEMTAIRVQLTARGAQSGRVLPLQRVAVQLGKWSGSRLLAEQIETLRLRGAPHYAAALRADMSGEEDFILFSLRIQDELIEALKQRNAVNAAELRGADLYTYQRFIYRRLGLE